jgi:hypothetical protein
VHSSITSMFQCIGLGSQNTKLTLTQQDPYYEKVPGKNRHGEATGKQVKQKRALPPGLSDHDAKVLMRVRRRVHRLDWSLFTIFGIGFGWSSVIGIIPG